MHEEKKSEKISMKGIIWMLQVPNIKEDEKKLYEKVQLLVSTDYFIHILSNRHVFETNC